MSNWQASEDFSKFVRVRHGEPLRFAHVLTGDRHLAEDLVQDALERTGLRWRDIQRKDDPEGYVRRTIVRRYINHRRDRRREVLVDTLPESVVPAGEASLDLWPLLATLPPKQRAVLVLRFYLDLTEVQAAKFLGCAVGTVKSDGSRAVATLRATLEIAGNSEDGNE